MVSRYLSVQRPTNTSRLLIYSLTLCRFATNIPRISKDNLISLCWTKPQSIDPARFGWCLGEWFSSYKFGNWWLRYLLQNFPQVIVIGPRWCMMTSSNGNFFRVTDHLCGEFTRHRWIPRTKASDAELWCFLWSEAWINGWVNIRKAGDLRRHHAHYHFIVMEKSTLVQVTALWHQATSHNTGQCWTRSMSPYGVIRQ